MAGVLLGLRSKSSAWRSIECASKHHTQSLHPLQVRRYRGALTWGISRSSIPAANPADSRRYRVTHAGVDKSGHIEAGKNEGIFFLDSMLDNPQ